MYIIDQKPFGSPDFCKAVTETMKKYAEERNLKASDLWVARRNKDIDRYEWHVGEDKLLEHRDAIAYLESALSGKYPAQMATLSEELSFSLDSLFAKVSKIVEGKAFRAAIIADCKSIWSRDGENYAGSLIDYDKPQTTVGLYLHEGRCKAEGYGNPEDLVRKKLLIHGEVSYYQPSNGFQIKASSIKVIGDCTMLQMESRWESECSGLLRTWEEVRSYPSEPSNPRKIGLVSNRNAQGYNDFMNTLKESFKNVPEIVEHNITLDVQNIVKALTELKDIPDIDYTVIVRGGGDRESLTRLCEPAMLRAIHSLGNVVTGIGHTDDKLLCGRAALYDAGTPTGAARFLKDMSTAFFRKQQQRKTAQKIEETKARTGFRNDKERADYWEEAYRQLEKAYNELIEDSKPKGILGAIKSLFG